MAKCTNKEPVTYTYTTYLPLKVFNNPLFADVVWQVADPQVPGLTHHLALRKAARAPPGSLGLSRRRLLHCWSGQQVQLLSIHFTHIGCIRIHSLLTSTCSHLFQDHSIFSIFRYFFTLKTNSLKHELLQAPGTFIGAEYEFFFLKQI